MKRGARMRFAQKYGNLFDSERSVAPHWPASRCVLWSSRSSSPSTNGHWYFVFKAIHVIFAVIWIGGGALLTILGSGRRAPGDPVDAGDDRPTGSHGRAEVFSPAAMVVLVAGIAMMINGSLDWGKFWVSFGLLGFASTFITGMAFLAPQSKKIVALTESHGVEAPETRTRSPGCS